MIHYLVVERTLGVVAVCATRAEAGLAAIAYKDRHPGSSGLIRTVVGIHPNWRLKWGGAHG